jgi:hypothetical protein
MKHLVTWMIGSTAFKKSAGMIGAFALGVLVQAIYWREIRDTLMVWGIEKNQYMAALKWLIAAGGLSGVGASIGLSAAKKQREKREGRET